MKMIRFCILIFLLQHQLHTVAQTDTVSAINKPKQLAEVVVKSKKPFVEQQVDKLVLNVQADLTATGSSVFEILQNAPGVSITGDDNISMSGRSGVNVMIDGRQVQMSQRDLINYLKSIPGTEIDKIEVISNPSSKYDAQGNAGIINIRFRKNKNFGTNGSAGINYVLGTHHRFGTSLSLNNRAGKLNLFANHSLTEGLQHTAGSVDRYVTNGTTRLFQNKTNDIDDWIGHTFQAGADYFINKRATIGFIIKGNIHHTGFITPGQTLMQDLGSNAIDSTVTALNKSDFDTRRMNYNINYSFSDTMGNELNVDLDYTDFHNDISTDIRNRLFNKTGNQTSLQQNLLGISTGIDIYSLKVDYVHPFRKLNAKLEAGAKATFVRTGNELLAKQLRNTILVPDTGRTNDFLYKENVQAVYVSYGQQLKKFEYQVGLRLENTIITGISTDLLKNTIQYPDTNYLNVFPTFFSRYRLSEKHQLALSYTRRINRPSYQDMNPFETLIDLYTAEKGNPNLRPEYQESIELKYTFKDAASFAAGYSKTKDVIQEITTQQGDRAFALPANLSSQQGIYFSINIPFTVKWWSFYQSATISNYTVQSTSPGITFENRSWGATGYVSNNFTVSKKFRMQLSSWFRFPGIDGVSQTKPFGSIDIGCQQSLFNDKATLRAGINDIFNTQRVTDVAKSGPVQYTYYRKWESRGFRISLNYKFGNNNVKSARQRSTAEDAERIKEK